MTRRATKTPAPGLALIAAIAVVVVGAVLALAGVYSLGTRSQPDREVAAVANQEIH